MRKKFRVKKILPKLILKEKTFSPKRLRDAILLEYNVEMTPQNISMWLKRHTETVEDLKSKIGEIDAQHDNIRFEKQYWISNDFKSQIPIIQEWIDTLIVRKVPKRYIRRRVMALRRICMGTKGTDEKFEKIMDWQIHPLALTEEKAMEYIVELNRRGYNDFRARLMARNFLKYGKGEEPRKIAGNKPSAKYGYLFVSKEKLNQILEWLLSKDYDIGAYCKFMFKTGTRAGSAKNAKLAHFNRKERTIVVWDKGRNGEKLRWIKHVDDDLFSTLEPLIEKGELFENIDTGKARELCREAYLLFIPELAKDIPFPLHFWRHMFAQHMLRATDWNYTVTAKLGGWKDKNTLEDNYGMPPDNIVQKWGIKYFPSI